MKKSRKRIIVTAAVIVGLLLVALVGGSGYFCYRTLNPDRMNDIHWLEEQYPHVVGWIDSIRQNDRLHDIYRPNARGEQLHALWLRAPQPTSRTAVLLHGYEGAAEAMFMIGYLYNHDLGYNVLMPDLRGHGKSQPRAVSMGWTERGEVLDWIRTADSLFGPEARVVVHGISMGAAATMIVCGEESLPASVRCAVEDCGYTSTYDIFHDAWGKQSRIPRFPLFQLSDLWCRILYGWSFREASPLEAVGRSRVPMMFIHGDRDSVVPVEMVYRLYEAKSGEKVLWVLPGVDHGAAYLEDPKEYTRRVGEFVGRWID